MELPNYSRQLMQQLQALRKDCQFCDCSILVEGTSHPAHKVVLSASSLLFRSLLDSSDSISIDTAVVSSQEFSSLLDLVYTGKLPPGKLNFSRVIAAADSLQMFDVAVGCKNVLNELVQLQVQSKDPQPLKEDLQINTPELNVPKGQDNLSSEEGTSDHPGVLDQSEKNTENTKGGAVELLSQQREEILQMLKDIQVWIKLLLTWDSLHTQHRQIMLECFDGDPGVDVVYQCLLDRVKDECDLGQTVLTLLNQFKSLKPDLDTVLEDKRGQQLKEKSAATLACSPDKHTSELTKLLTNVDNLSELLTQAADRCKNEVLKEVLLECNGEQNHMQVIERLLSMLSEREIKENCLLELLQETEESTKDLNQLEGPRTTEEPKPSSSLQAAGSEEKEEEEDEDQKQSLQKKGVMVSYSCQWCNKSFDFKCRLIRHRKRCALSPGKVQCCPDCPLQFPSLTALHQHCSQAHGHPAAKKKKTEPVTCDLCSKTFKHPSGLLYHRRTEHLEERPYVCEECGAKFAANSSLKNHVRLHTGEKPYQCKHCDMSFTVAAALSYHTKKKHSEGKMYSCQYCSATFAQSIELTRHVRTHTGDKPYVCRECGRGFKQANGLSVHLQSFHNVSEPHDCQKCRVSFGSLEELREHIQEVHPKELHQCPQCSRILSTAAQLEKHMSIHDGSKPYTCKTCHKSYQTLSGLWYHNRTTHPDLVTSKGSRPLSHLLHCKICNKTFCNRSSLFKHHITTHPETPPDEELEEKETKTEASLWRCVYCEHVMNTAQELQHHVSTEHVSQQGSVFGCVVCSRTFTSEAEFQQHFLTTHLQVIQEEEPTQVVIQTQATSAEGAEHTAGLDQSQQVFVALGEDGQSAGGSGIVAVNMEDLLTGRITLICEENS